MPAVNSESKHEGNSLLFGNFIDVEANPWFDSESGTIFKENRLWRVL
ncbi:hypothetical protein GRAQ_02683 [Rahnella aquatilis CIP 78.65 = ATCC 33071]|nr:hypothetical protein GRAQ_02683 [Rahnella aquatilis CIP 78.65 = ATCC 33071]